MSDQLSREPAFSRSHLITRHCSHEWHSGSRKVRAMNETPRQNLATNPIRRAREKPGEMLLLLSALM